MKPLAQCNIMVNSWYALIPANPQRIRIARNEAIAAMFRDLHG